MRDWFDADYVAQREAEYAAKVANEERFAKAVKAFFAAFAGFKKGAFA